MIDNAAHVGGVLGGALAGWCLARPLQPGRAAGGGRALLTVMVAVALALVALKALPRPADFLAALDAFYAGEKSFLEDYERLVERVQRHEIGDRQYATELQAHVIPAWRVVKATLTGPGAWPPAQERLRGLLVRYAEARERALDGIARAFLDEDAAALQAAQEHKRELEHLQDEIKSWKPE